MKGNNMITPRKSRLQKARKALLDEQFSSNTKLATKIEVKPKPKAGRKKQEK